MTEFLDDLYSSFIAMLVIAFFLLFLFVFLATLKPFKNNGLNKVYKMLMYLCSVTFFFTIPLFNYGHAKRFERIAFGKTTICLFEQAIRAVGKSAGKPARIHILDIETGVRKERFAAGKPGEMLGMRNDTLCYLDEKDVVLYDADNLKEIYRIKEEEWGTILPELAVGVENIDITDQTVNHIVSHFIKLDCLNGKKYWFEPFSKKIYTKQPVTEYITDFDNKKSKLTVKISDNQELKYLQTSSSGQGRLEYIVPGYNGTKYFSRIDSTGYINPFLLCIDTVKKIFVFGYYTTTKKEDYFIEAKDFDYNTKWKKANNELVDETKNPGVAVCKYRNNIMYFTIGSYFFAADPVTFKLYWKIQL